MPDPAVDEFYRLLEELRRTNPDLYRQIVAILLAMWGSEDAVVVLTIKQLLWEQLKTVFGASDEAMRIIAKIFRLRPLHHFKALPPAVTLAGVAEAAAVVSLPVVTILAPLVLVANKLGDVGIDTDYWARDRCEDAFDRLTDAYATHRAARRGYPAQATRQTTSQLLEDARLLVIYLGRFLKDCPDYAGVSFVRKMLAAAEAWRDEYLDWLAAH